MVFCGWYRRAVRDVDLAVYALWVRRGRCSVCRGQNHALLPSFCLPGRLDVVAVIGSAISAVVMHEAVVSQPPQPDAGVPATTVRSWVRRHRQRAQELLFGLLGAAGMSAQAGGFTGPAERSALVTLVGLGWALSVPLGLGSWPAVSVLTNGAWLRVRMNPRWEDAARRRLMIFMSGLGPP